MHHFETLYWVGNPYGKLVEQSRDPIVRYATTVVATGGHRHKRADDGLTGIIPTINEQPAVAAGGG